MLEQRKISLLQHLRNWKIWAHFCELPLFLPLMLPEALVGQLSDQGMDHLLHPIRTGLPHPCRDVTIHVQGKGGRGVAQILLDRFNIISSFNRHGGIGVAQVVKTGGGNAQFLYNALIAVLDRAVGQISADLVGKHPASVRP